MIQLSHFWVYTQKNIKDQKHDLKENHTPMFIGALFAVAKREKQFERLLIDTWINKLCYIYTKEYYVAFKRKEILSHTTT